MINESKYKISGDSLVNKNTGIAIPDDEPLFVFRAQDKKALAALVAYQKVCDFGKHRRLLDERIEAFRQFVKDNPEKMKDPD